MAKEEKTQQGFPKTIELRNKLITCPACKAKIEVDMDLDMSFMSDLAQSFQKMNQQKKKEGVEKKDVEI